MGNQQSQSEIKIERKPQLGVFNGLVLGNMNPNCKDEKINAMLAERMLQKYNLQEKKDDDEKIEIEEVIVEKQIIVEPEIILSMQLPEVRCYSSVILEDASDQFSAFLIQDRCYHTISKKELTFARGFEIGERIEVGSPKVMAYEKSYQPVVRKKKEMMADNFKIEPQLETKITVEEIAVEEVDAKDIHLEKLQNSKMYQSFTDRKMKDQFDTIPEVEHENQTNFADLENQSEMQYSQVLRMPDLKRNFQSDKKLQSAKTQFDEQSLYSSSNFGSRFNMTMPSTNGTMASRPSQVEAIDQSTGNILIVKFGSKNNKRKTNKGEKKRSKMQLTLSKNLQKKIEEEKIKQQQLRKKAWDLM